MYHFKKQNVKKEYVFFALLLLATTPSFAVWAIGGLEQPLYVLLITLVITEVYKIIHQENFKRLYILSIWLGLLALTRPDGFLFTILTAGFLLYIKRENKKSISTILGSIILIPSIFLLGQLMFRYQYYGEWVPNTALVKVKVTLHHILRGGYYNFKAFIGTIVLSSLGFYSLFLLAVNRKNIFGCYLLLNIVAWVSYITMVGGDIFPAFRHYYVILIFFVFAITAGIQYASKIDLKNKKVKILLAISLILNVFVQTYIPANQYAKNERWEFDGMMLGNKLKNIFPENTLIAVTAAGCIPYSSELPTIDMLGLNDHYLARNPPPGFGDGPLAHELGDANYVIRRNPDIIIFGIGSQPIFNVGDQLRGNKIFIKNYTKVSIKNKNNRTMLFFNKYGANTGIKFKERNLIIPGYLFKNEIDNINFFEKSKLIKSIKKEKKYSLEINKSEFGSVKFESNLSENSCIETKIFESKEAINVILWSKKDTLIENLSFRVQN